jgi:23S rRNA pseudouridine1911/1915/1917 synthase
MAHIGHPLAGDTRYGGKQGELGLSSQCLFAKTLAFAHPRMGKYMEFSIKPPSFFTNALEKAAR